MAIGVMVGHGDDWAAWQSLLITLQIVGWEVRGT